MANNLIQKGYQLVVHDVVESAVSQAVSSGAKRASSPAEVMKGLTTNVTSSCVL